MRRFLGWPLTIACVAFVAWLVWLGGAWLLLALAALGYYTTHGSEAQDAYDAKTDRALDTALGIAPTTKGATEAAPPVSLNSHV